MPTASVLNLEKGAASFTPGERILPLPPVNLPILDGKPDKGTDKNSAV